MIVAALYPLSYKAIGPGGFPPGEGKERKEEEEGVGFAPYALNVTQFYGFFGYSFVRPIFFATSSINCPCHRFAVS